MPSNIKRALFIICLYFIGYMFILPRVVTGIISVIGHEDFVLVMVYGIYLYSHVYLLNNELRTGYEKIKVRFFSFIKSLLKNYGILLLVSIVGGLLVSLIVGNAQSVNQVEVEKALLKFPVSTVFSALCFAPFVEEIVFRYSIRELLKNHLNPTAISIISGLCFGACHVFDSILMGNLLDIIYIVVYGALGFVICQFYQKENHLLAPVCLHFLNNFVSLLIQFL